MTSLAFIFGILPLTWATGAGSASRNSLGTAVFGGMIVSTVLNLIFVPVIYVVIASIRSRLAGHPHTRVAMNNVNGELPIASEVPAGLRDA